MIEFSITKNDKDEYDLSSYMTRGRFAIVHGFSKMFPDGVVTYTVNTKYFFPTKKVGNLHINEDLTKEDIKNSIKLYKKYGDVGYKNFMKDDKGFIKYIKDTKESESTTNRLLKRIK